MLQSIGSERVGHNLATEKQQAIFSFTQKNLYWLSACYCCSVAQSLSQVWLFENPWTVACQASLSFTISWSLLRLTSMTLMIPPSHLILCHPLLLLPSVFPSIKVFSSELSLCIRWPKNRSFSFSIGPSNEYSGLISFRINWLGLPAVQGTLKSLLQHHSSKASILPCSAFFMVQFSHLYITIGKTTALTIQTLSAKRYLCFVIHCLGKVS